MIICSAGYVGNYLYVGIGLSLIVTPPFSEQNRESLFAYSDGEIADYHN